MYFAISSLNYWSALTSCPVPKSGGENTFLWMRIINHQHHFIWLPDDLPTVRIITLTLFTLLKNCPPPFTLLHSIKWIPMHRAFPATGGWSFMCMQRSLPFRLSDLPSLLPLRADVSLEWPPPSRGCSFLYWTAPGSKKGVYTPPKVETKTPYMIRLRWYFCLETCDISN